MNGKETLGVVDTAAQVTVLKRSLFEQIVPRPKTITTIVLKGIGNFSQMDARLVPNVCVTIGKSTIKWDVVVADIEDYLILGIDFLENQKAIINLTDYSIELRGEKVPSMVFSTIERQQNKVYRVKTARKTFIPPHTDRISHDEEKVQDLKEIEEGLPFHLRNLLKRSQENITPQQSIQLATLLLKLQDIFFKDDLDMSAPDLLVSPKKSDHYSVSASDLLMSQTGNNQGSSSASDLLMSQGAVDRKDTQGSFGIDEKRIITNLEEVIHDNPVNLDETFLYTVDNRIDYAGSFLFVSQGQRRAIRRPVYLDDFPE